jgi:VWFA-related protein
VVLVVSLPVIVQDREGRFIVDLRREEFHIFDNGFEQKIAHFASLEEPFSVVLLLDTSGSTRLRLKDIQDSAIAFIDALKPADRVYPVSFDNQVRALIPDWTSDRIRLSESIRSTRTGMDSSLHNQISRSKAKDTSPTQVYINTSLYDAVKMASDLLKPIQGRKAIIVFSDGFDRLSRLATADSTLKEAGELGAFVYSLKYDGSNDRAGQGFEADTGYEGFRPPIQVEKRLYMENLAKKTGGRYFRVGDLRKIGFAFDSIAKELRHQYSLGYYPDPLPRLGEKRRIQVKVDRGKVSLRTRNGYVFRSHP